jgi:hypothetical protein
MRLQAGNMFMFFPFSRNREKERAKKIAFGDKGGIKGIAPPNFRIIRPVSAPILFDLPPENSLS